MVLAMAADDSFADVMTRLQAGDQAAAREVFERFVQGLVRLAQRRLDPLVRRKVDPEDVVQSAYRSFFVRFGAGKLDVQGWGNLWGLLTMITLRKCLDRAEYHRAAIRDVQREAAAQPGSAGSEPWWEAIAREPSPEEAVVLAETVEQLVRDLDADERPILEKSLQGYTTQEICQELNLPERSVRRLRERIRKRLERMQLADL
jgi:RNA polymerase sigma-70 factor (ECF subfamily)